MATRKQATRVWQGQPISQFILIELVLDVFLNFYLVLSYRINAVSPAPKFTIALFEL